MAEEVITYDECKENFGSLTSLQPRPHFENIIRMEEELIEKAKLIHTHQSVEMGIASAFMQPPAYEILSP